MGTLSCDTEAINSNVIPPLGASCEYLGEALEIINSIEIPSGLNINIKDASSKISGVITEVTSIESWIWAVVSKFNEAEKNNNDLIKKIIDAQARDVDLPQGNFQMSDSLNLAIAFSKGLAGFGENLLDALVIFATNAANTGEFVGGEFRPYEADKIGKVIGDRQREEIMNFVADDHVGDAYNKFYKNSDIGKWLDYNANEIFKSDGIGSNIASGIGNVTGIAGLTLLTGGTSIFTSVAIAGTTATGKYTGEYWANARSEASSTGKNWATEDVQNKGTLYGIANGTWEAAQWYVGGQLNNLNIKGVSEFVNSAARVGIDTAFNALDTPYRTLIDVMTSDRTIQEAWDNRGGWESFITDVGIGLIGSTGGEVLDGLKKGKSGDGQPAKTNVTAKKVVDVKEQGEITLDELDEIKGGHPNGIIDDIPSSKKLEAKELEKITDNISTTQTTQKSVTKDWKNIGLNANDITKMMNIEDRADYAQFKMKEYFQKHPRERYYRWKNRRRI